MVTAHCALLVLAVLHHQILQQPAPQAIIQMLVKHIVQYALLDTTVHPNLSHLFNAQQVLILLKAKLLALHALLENSVLQQKSQLLMIVHQASMLLLRARLNARCALLASHVQIQVLAL